MVSLIWRRIPLVGSIISRTPPFVPVLIFAPVILVVPIVPSILLLLPMLLVVLPVVVVVVVLTSLDLIVQKNDGSRLVLQAGRWEELWNICADKFRFFL